MKRNPTRKSVLLFLLWALPLVATLPALGANPEFFLSCEADNDLYQVLTRNDIRCSRYQTPAEAIEKAPVGSPVLVLGAGYPATTTPIEPSVLRRAREKKIRLYIEYPSSLPGLPGGPSSRTQWERAVITSDRFGKRLAPRRIIGIQDCHYIPFRAASPWIVIAKVAGFDTAVYGIPESRQPILFEHDGLLVGATKLSQFVTGRYAPLEAWPVIWGTILKWLTEGQSLPELKFEPLVRPSYRRDEPLPPDHERRAALRGVDWYWKARFLVHDEWQDQWAEAADWEDRVAPGPRQDQPAGDGSRGMLEGFSSRVLYDGKQYVRWYLRADCNAESAMAFALRSRLDNHGPSRRTASNLLDYVYFESDLQQGPRADPQSASYGLLGWDTLPDRVTIYYGDDNARALLATMAAAAALKSERWDEGLLRGILGNFRTTGRKGFRGNRHQEKELQASGWKSLFDSDRVNFAPHYESWLWATYLWLYHKTGYEPLWERARTAIALTMAVYPDQWRWTNGIQQERARMILPLAWLVRVDDTAKHREWLRLVTADLLDKQAESGAIREEIGVRAGRYGPPKSNEEYGRDEASLLQANGDPVCDLLYTTNFAFLALHEAAGATDDQYYSRAEDRLADFLCRIQARSKTRPEFDGVWFRAFEYDRWDYWASNADVGWGAWAAETGWTQAWITSVMALRQQQTSLWELTAGSTISRPFELYRNLMLPD